MQAYFDEHDAELEYESIVSRSGAKAEPSVGNDVHPSARRYTLEVVVLAVLMFTVIFVFTDHLVSANPVMKISKPDPQVKTPSFVIEIPPQIKEKPKREPEFQEPKKEPPPKERLRSVPDRQIEQRQMVEKIKDRDNREQQHDRNVSDKTTKRAMPAVATPVIERSPDLAERVDSDEMLAYACMDAYADTIGAYTQRSSTEGDVRSVPSENVSRIKLDPYHYQMVNVCLRLCMKSMFTHSGMSEQRRERSSTWLRMYGSARFEYMDRGKWLEFRVFTDRIADISNINFVEIPYQGKSDEEINKLLESVTADLCSLLGYSDCLDQLKQQ
jgi:hypothetical protein